MLMMKLNHCLKSEVYTVKPVLSSHSKIDKTKVLKTDYCLMQVKTIAECSNWEHAAILLTCIKVVRDPCQKITLLLLKSKSVRVIVPESCF